MTKQKPGRRKGADHPMAKLTPEQVAAIRAARGVTQARLAAEHGVSQSTVSTILNNRRWRA